MESYLLQSPTFQHGHGKLVRNKESTCFWLDRWVDSTPLQELIVWHIPHQYIYRTTVSYWVVGWEENWQELQSLLPQSSLLKLAAVYVFTTEDAPDLLAWLSL